MHRVEVRFLRRLREAPSQGLPCSSVPLSCAALVQRLETCGAVQLVATPRGRLLRVLDLDAFNRAVGSMCPEGLSVDLDGVRDRAGAVVVLGDAKGIRRGACQGVFVRSVKPGVCLTSVYAARTVSVTELTAIAGGAAILLDGGVPWTFVGIVATIENEEPFWRHHLVLPEVDLAVYTHGKMSDRLIAWLSSGPMQGCRFVHWGDYDPMGVSEYRRLAAACPGRVELHVPADLETLLSRYGKLELITKQIDVLAGLRDEPADPVIHRLVHLFDHHRRGLEQEILLRRGSRFVGKGMG